MKREKHNEREREVEKHEDHEKDFLWVVGMLCYALLL